MFGIFGADIDYGWVIKDYGTSESERERLAPVNFAAFNAQSLAAIPM
jgi:hypothetical protein